MEQIFNDYHGDGTNNPMDIAELIDFLTEKAKNSDVKINSISDYFKGKRVRYIVSKMNFDLTTNNPNYYIISKSNRTNPFTLFTLDDTLTFGMYIDYSVRAVLVENPSYILWSIINIPYFIVDNVIFTDETLFNDVLFLKAMEYNMLKEKIDSDASDLEEDDYEDDSWEEQREDPESRMLYDEALRNWSRRE